MFATLDIAIAWVWTCTPLVAVLAFSAGVALMGWLQEKGIA